MADQTMQLQALQNQPSPRLPRRLGNAAIQQRRKDQATPRGPSESLTGLAESFKNPEFFSELTLRDFPDLAGQSGSQILNTVISKARGTPGGEIPIELIPYIQQFASLPKTELAEADRYTQGAQARRAYGPVHGALLAGGSGGLFELAKNFPPILEAGAETLAAFGFPAEGAKLRVDETTSPPSLENVLQLIKGAWGKEDLEVAFPRRSLARAQRQLNTLSVKPSLSDLF